jgi:hypothetical protein
MTTINNDTKKVFLKLGTCSRTFCFLLDREFGFAMEMEEKAADPLAGGIFRRGHQCGMLWGSALAAGSESFRRYSDRGRAIAAAITSSRNLAESFSKRAGSVNCREVCGYDLTKKLGMLKFMVKFLLHIDRYCLDLAEQWVPEAIQSASEGLSLKADASKIPVSCASEVAKRMGAGDREMVMVAGFAGGLGLNGNGCGALAAAIWMRTMAWMREHPGKSTYDNPYAKKILRAFCDATGSEMMCHVISGRRFTSIDDHTEFIMNGGCEKIISLLTQL